MSAWRRKVIECLPENRYEYQDEGTTIYTVFFDLRPATVDAHIAGNSVLLKKYYAFAEWCLNHEELRNAAGVAFYEHLGDEEVTLAQMDLWVRPEVFSMIRPLLDARLPEDKMQRIDRLYGSQRKRW